MAGKFRAMTDSVSMDLSALFNRSIRKALLDGLTMAVSLTVHDSSNAAAHWLIAARGVSRPGGRTWGKLRDLRGTSTPPVGKRRSYGAQEIATIKFVRDRELRDVVDKLISGRSPATVFYFYNAIARDWEYGKNAKLGEAEAAAVEEVSRQFNKAMAAGNVRKRYR